MVRWKLDIPEETDRNVREYLNQMRGEQSDLSRFVDQAVNRVMLMDTVEALWERNKDLSSEDAQKLADAAVDEARAHRP